MTEADLGVCVGHILFAHVSVFISGVIGQKADIRPGIWAAMPC